MAQWLLELKGAAYDAETLRRFLPNEIRVEQRDGKYWLVVNDDDIIGHDAARMHLTRVLALCNAYALTRLSDFRKITAGALRRAGEDGRTVDYITASTAILNLRAYSPTIFGVQDGPSPPPPSETEWFDLAEAESCVGEVLKCSVDAERKWYERCWDVYERIRDDLNRSSSGTPGRTVVTGWMGEDPQARFGPSVNHYRHAGKEPLPDDPMGASEASEFVRRLLGKWLDHKLANL
jgi:hypothetical protein